MSIIRLNRLQETASAYQTPSVTVADISPEGVLCGSIRDIENLEVLPEQDW